MSLSFSIVIPTHNRLRQLARCLDALAHIQYPRELWHVIVVDDASRVSPRDIVDARSKQLNLQLLGQAHAGPAAARNRGVHHAHGEIVAFTDDDCMPAPDWLNCLATASEKNPDCIIGGRTLNGLPDNLCATASQMLISYLYNYYNPDPNCARFFTSNNFAIPREQFIRAGGFDATYPHAAAEDREFCDRWLFLGGRMVYAPHAIVYHAHNLSLREFWQQHSYYGRGAVRFRRARARRQQESVQVEPFRFYVNLLRYPFVTLRGARAWSVVGLLMIAQVANALGFCLEAMRFRK
jgi:GT2 family glycosyltransferase